MVEIGYPGDIQFENYRNCEIIIRAGTSYQDNEFNVITLLGRSAVSLLVLVKFGLMLGVKLNTLDSDAVLIDPEIKRFKIEQGDRLKIKKVFFDNSQSGATDALVQIFLS